MSEVGERMKGGAVKEDKSPENEAILISAQGGERGWGQSEGQRSREDLRRTISGRRSRIHADSLGRPKCVKGGGRWGADMNQKLRQSPQGP